MGSLGWPEILIILVAVVVLFGGTRLAGIGKGLGQGIKEFKAGIKDGDADGEEEEDPAPVKKSAKAAKPAKDADA
jgi:sec-independent protein translocase protein TatA